MRDWYITSILERNLHSSRWLSGDDLTRFPSISYIIWLDIGLQKRWSNKYLTCHIPMHYNKNIVLRSILYKKIVESIPRNVSCNFQQATSDQFEFAYSPRFYPSPATLSHRMVKSKLPTFWTIYSFNDWV